MHAQYSWTLKPLSLLEAPTARHEIEFLQHSNNLDQDQTRMIPSGNQLLLQTPSPESPPPPCITSALVQRGNRKRKAGRKKFQETRHPVYKGVRRRNGKWVCELRQPHTKCRIWLGTFSCPEMAARAHDVAALALKGESASLNFPETAHLLPRAKSASIKDIQLAALELAADDHHKKSTFTTSVTACSARTSPGGAITGDYGDLEGQIKVAARLQEGPRRRLFVDEDELFNMPALIDSMAEGLILTPPALKRGFSWCGYEENEAYMDLNLWTE